MMLRLGLPLELCCHTTPSLQIVSFFDEHHCDDQRLVRMHVCMCVYPYSVSRVRSYDYMKNTPKRTQALGSLSPINDLVLGVA